MDAIAGGLGPIPRWREFHTLKWTDDFNELVLVAGLPPEQPGWNIDIPRGTKRVLLEIELDLMIEGTTESFKTTIPMRRTRNSYSSYSFDQMVAF